MSENIVLIQITSPQISVANAGTVSLRINRLIELCRKTQVAPDAVLCNGNLTASGSEQEFDLFHEHIGLRFSQQMSVPVLVVPGLSDIEISAIDRLSQKGLRTEISEPNGGEAVWTDHEQRTKVLLRLKNFSHFVQNHEYSQSLLIRRKMCSVRIIGLNSVWTCNSPSDRDGFITNAQIDSALNHYELESDMLSIGYFHHSISDIHASDFKIINNSLSDKFDLILTSNPVRESLSATHLPRAFSINGLMSDDSVLQGHVISLRPSERAGVLTGLKWNASIGQFASAAIGEHGESLELFFKKGTELESKLQSFRDDIRTRTKERSLERLERQLPPILAGKTQLPTIDRLLEPHIVCVTDKKERFIRIPDILKDHRHYIIEGPVQSGKTTLLDFLEAKFCSNSVAFRIGYMDIEAIHFGTRGLLTLLTERSGYAKRRISHLMSGEFILLIDNAALRYTEEQWRAIDSWVDNLPSMRLIVSGRPVPIHESLDSLSGKWIRCELRPMTISSIKKEVARLESMIASGKKVQSLSSFIETLVHAELPRWPWVILILFELARNCEIIEISNLAMLLQRYTELRLRAIESATSTLLPRVPKRMLCLMSHRMMDNRTHALDKGQVLEIMKEDMIRSGNPDQSLTLLDALLDSKIIFMSAGKVSFAFFVLQEYYYAENMIESRWSGIGALDADSVIRYGGALALFAERITVPDLLRQTLAVAIDNAPNAHRTIAVDDLKNLEQFIDNLAEEELLDNAKAAAKQQEANLERTISVAERRTQGSRQERLRTGARAMGQLMRFSQLMNTSTTVLRSCNFVDLAEKKTGVSSSLDLCSSFIAEFIYNEKILRYLVESLSDEFDIDDNEKHNVATLLSVFVIISFGCLLGTLGAGRHLITAIEGVFESETDDFRRLLLLIWHYSADHSSLIPMMKSFLSRCQKNLTYVRLLEFWLQTEYIRGTAYENSNIGDVERGYRMAIEQRIRITQGRVSVIDKSRITDSKIKGQIDNSFAAARKQKNVQDMILHRTSEKDGEEWRKLDYFPSLGVEALAELGDSATLQPEVEADSIDPEFVSPEAAIVSPTTENVKMKDRALTLNRIKPWDSSLQEKEYLVTSNTLGATEAERVLRSLESYGICLLRISGQSPEEIVLDSLSKLIGQAMTKQNDYSGRIKLIQPRTDGQINSGDTTQDIGLHVDGTQHEKTPAILVFQYLTEPKIGGESVFVDLANVFGQLSESERLAIVSAFGSASAAQFEKKGMSFSGPMLTKVPWCNSLCFRIRFDSVMKLDGPSRLWYERIRQLADSEASRLVFRPLEGDIVIFDNWRLLHARDEVHGVRIRQHRRMWISELLHKHQPTYLLGVRPVEIPELALLEKLTGGR